MASLRYFDVSETVLGKSQTYLNLNEILLLKISSVKRKDIYLYLEESRVRSNIDRNWEIIIYHPSSFVETLFAPLLSVLV